jgi:hypothetical protein
MPDFQGDTPTWITWDLVWQTGDSRSFTQPEHTQIFLFPGLPIRGTVTDASSMRTSPKSRWMKRVSTD